MPAVIAMTEKVTVKTALALGAKFYEQLRQSGEVDSALHEALAGLAERGDVTVPALFSRLGGRPLFSDQLDRELTNTDIQYGLEQFEKLLSERAPALQSRLSEPAQKLGNSLGADITALSKLARYEREQALSEVNTLCEEIVDLSFNALALGQQPPAYNSRCPFLGLYPFREENREFFFGREQLIAQLQQKLTEHNFLAVLGASGSGKSSVVLAGLIPTLHEQQPSLVVSYMTPSNNPMAQLQATLCYVEKEQLNPLVGGVLGNGEWGIEREWVAMPEPATESTSSYISVTTERSLSATVHKTAILVIDQFEELFTLCTDETERRAFIEQVLNLTQQQKVVITMRADFWGECAPYRELKELMEARQKLIAPMDVGELRKAMEMQAAKVGLRFEAGLSNSILDDVQGEPGAMPLLQHALLELWKRRHGRWLQATEYEAIGGVKMAIAQTADNVYNTLSLPEQGQVKNIFIRLTRLDDSAIQGEKGRDTRRRVWLDELVPAGGTTSDIKELVNRLAGEGARLVVTSIDESTNREEVEVAHEALIRYWPRLLNWLDENRTNLQLRETIRQAALEWEKQQKDNNYLVHRGGRLDDAQILSKQAGFLNQVETNYVNTCVELGLRQIREKKRSKRRTLGLTFAIIAVISLFGISVALFVGLILLLLVLQPNVIFASPGQKIQGTSNYIFYQKPKPSKRGNDKNLLFLYVDKELLFKQDSNPVFGKKLTPAQTKLLWETKKYLLRDNEIYCEDLGKQVELNNKQQKSNNFKLTAPKEPGIYYIKTDMTLASNCDNGKQEWVKKFNYVNTAKYGKQENTGEVSTDDTESTIGVILVGGGFNFFELWDLSSQDIPDHITFVTNADSKFSKFNDPDQSIEAIYRLSEFSINKNSP